MSNTVFKRFVYDLEETKKNIIHKYPLDKIEKQKELLPYRYMLELLNLSIDFLKPLENETSESAHHFFKTHHFFSAEQNTTQKLRKSLDSLYSEFGKTQNPIDFYTKPYERRAHYLFISVLILLILTTVLSIAAMFLSTFTCMQIISFILINTGIGGLLTTIGILQLQKSKTLQHAFEELKLFDESNMYGENNFNLFHQYQEAELRIAIV